MYIRDLKPLNNPENVKVGDLCIVEKSCFGRYSYSVKTIDRVTKTKIVVGNIEFKNGTTKSSGTWSPTHDNIYEYEEAAAQLIRETNKKINSLAAIKDMLTKKNLDEIASCLSNNDVEQLKTIFEKLNNNEN